MHYKAFAALNRLVAALDGDSIYELEGEIREVHIALRYDPSPLIQKIESQRAELKIKQEKIDKLVEEVKLYSALCRAKRKYSSQAEAIKCSHGKLHAYLCGNCKSWHNSTPKKLEKKVK